MISPSGRSPLAGWWSFRWDLIFLTLVSIRSLVPWGVAAWKNPDDPLASLILYSGLDICYAPLVSELSQLSLHDPAVFEKEGTGVTSFPVASILPHALCCSIFGECGYVVAGILVTFAYYGVALLLLKSFGIAPPLRQFLAFLLVVGLQFVVQAGYASPGYTATSPDWPWGASLILLPWGERIPRPFVAEVYLVLGMASLFLIAREYGSYRRFAPWVLLGIACAGLMQSDLAGFSFVALSGALLFGWAWILSGGRWIALLLRATVAAGVAAVLSLPFLYQRLSEIPDIPRRFGVFEIDRSNPPFLDGKQANTLILTVGALLLLFSVVRRGALRTERERVAGLATCLAFTWVGHYSVPLITILLGKGVQLQLFPIQAAKATGYLLLYLAFEAYREWAARRLSDAPGEPRPWVKRACLAVACVFLLLLVGREWDSQIDGHKRNDFQEYAELENYRSNFLELVQFLSRDSNTELKVMGTFDHQVYAWWCAFENGKSFLPDPFATVLSDDEIESRLAWFCRSLGMSADSFGRFIQEHFVHVLWFAHNKYQASGAYRFSEMEDYLPETRKRIEKARVEDSWEIAVPIGETKRMVEKFRDLPPEAPGAARLDFVVLDKTKNQNGLAPPTESFSLKFENDAFRVYLRD